MEKLRRPGTTELKFPNGKAKCCLLPVTGRCCIHLGSPIHFIHLLSQPVLFEENIARGCKFGCSKWQALMAVCPSLGEASCPAGEGTLSTKGPLQSGAHWPTTCSSNLGHQSQLPWKQVGLFCMARGGWVSEKKSTGYTGNHYPSGTVPEYVVFSDSFLPSLSVVNRPLSNAPFDTCVQRIPCAHFLKATPGGSSRERLLG